MTGQVTQATGGGGELTSGTLTRSRSASARNASTRLRGNEMATDTDLSVRSSGGRPRRRGADIARIFARDTSAISEAQGYTPSNRQRGDRQKTIPASAVRGLVFRNGGTN